MDSRPTDRCATCFPSLSRCKGLADRVRAARSQHCWRSAARQAMDHRMEKIPWENSSGAVEIFAVGDRDKDVLSRSLRQCAVSSARRKSRSSTFAACGKCGITSRSRPAAVERNLRHRVIQALDRNVNRGCLVSTYDGLEWHDQDRDVRLTQDAVHDRTRAYRVCSLFARESHHDHSRALLPSD